MVTCCTETCRYDESISRKQALEEELSDLEGKLERAEKLVTGLAGGCTWGCELTCRGVRARRIACRVLP